MNDATWVGAVYVRSFCSNCDLGQLVISVNTVSLVVCLFHFGPSEGMYSLTLVLVFWYTREPTQKAHPSRKQQCHSQLHEA
jgi:hypothetical protein